MALFPDFRKLQWKVSAFLALSLLVVLGTASLFYQRFLSVQMIKKASVDAALVADTIHLGLAQSMINNNQEGIQLTLQDILNNSEIREVLIADPGGRVVFASSRELVGQNLRHTPFAVMERGRSWKVVDGPEGKGSEIYSLSSIQNRAACQECHHSQGRAVLGTIALRLSLERSEEILSRSAYFLAVLTVLVLFLTFLINERFFSGKVTRPIDNLLRRFEEVSVDGVRQREQPAPPSSDEIGMLAGRFEELVGEVRSLHEREMEKEKEFVLLQQDRAHQEELEDMNRQLSAQVKELDEANHRINNLARKVEGKNESLKNAVKNISALNRVGVALSSELDINRLVKLLINVSVKGLRAEIGYIMLIDEERNTLAMKAWTGLGDDFDPSPTVEPGESISGKVAETCKSLLIRRIDGSGGIKRESRYGFRRRTVISAPIKIKNRLLGVIELTNKKGSESFNEDDLAMMQSIANQAAVAIENANLYRELQKSYFDTIRALVQAVEETDKYTRGHSERVTTFSVKIAERMGFAENKLESVRYGGVLHDIGKIGIDVNIIQKPGRLTQAEFNIIKNHPLIGERIISPIEFLKDVLPVVSQHHERYDGLGYPRGISGTEVVPEARILAVADAYDAMITARPYRNPLPRKEAIAELRRCSGTQFDPLVVEVFLEALEEDQEIRKLEESLSTVGT